MNDETARAHRGFDRDGASSHDTQAICGDVRTCVKFGHSPPCNGVIESSLRANDSTHIITGGLHPFVIKLKPVSSEPSHFGVFVCFMHVSWR